MVERPKVKSESQKELDKIESEFKEFDQQVKDLTLDRLNTAPTAEFESQTRISQADRERMKQVYLKPERAIASKEKFNEKFREEYNFAKEYVQFECENHEIIGENIELWTKPFPGVAAEFWRVPVNKNIWGPRYLAEQISKCKYHRLYMDNKVTNSDGVSTYYGTIAVDKTIPRLEARPVSGSKSIFMGEHSFK